MVNALSSRNEISSLLSNLSATEAKKRKYNSFAGYKVRIHNCKYFRYTVIWEENQAWCMLMQDPLQFTGWIRPPSGLWLCQSLPAFNMGCFKEKAQPSVYIRYDTIAKSCDLPAWQQWKMKTSGGACRIIAALRAVRAGVLIRKGMIIKLIQSAPPHSKLPLLLS